MLDESNVRGLLELLGEVSGLSSDLSHKKQLLLSGLSRLIHGDGWSWSLMQKSDKSAVYLDAMSGGDAQVLPKRETLHTWKAPVLKSVWLNGPRKPASAPAGSPNSPTYRLTLSFHLLSDETVSHLLIARRAGSQPFSPGEEELVRVVAEEIPWLHELNQAASPMPARLKLPPRQQATLDLLIQGCSYKAISEHLRVSPHTVHEYIKQIYRSFGINSRAGLIKQLALRGP